jgi:pSer/pThr/pTyr-binding forkhead associated (FHA) protein
MKSFLVIGGVLFILLALVLFAGAVVLFVIARRRRAASMPHAAAPVPDAAPVAPAPYTPAPAAAPRTQVADDPNATMVVNVRNQMLGALHGTSPNVSGRVIPIDQYGVYIGRDQTLSQVIVDSPDVSKRHVWVGVKDGNAVAVDQGSTNGTFLNTPGSAIREVRLKSGDVLILANDAARFTYK